MVDQSAVIPARQQLIVADYRRGIPVRDILCDWCISGATLTYILRKAREPLAMPQRRNGKRRQYLKRQERIMARAAQLPSRVACDSLQLP